MFKNYISVALRNLLKDRLYSVINIMGLAIGLAACVLILLFVRDELSYDTFWEKQDRLYRFHTTFNVPGREPFVLVNAPGPAKGALERYFENEIERVTRFAELGPILKLGDRVVREEVYWTDPETADMFDLTVIAGDIHAALSDNASLAINSSFAKRYFGDTDPIGQVLTLATFDLERDYRVAAVFEDLPGNTVLNFQALAMIDEQDFINQPSLFSLWFSVNTNIYFELKEGVSIDAVNSRMVDFTDNGTDLPPESLSEDTKPSDFIDFSTMAIADIQLNPAGAGEMKPTGDKQIVTVFAAIAGLVLLIACINFTNLSTAKSTQRAREVALRKVLGANRRNLIEQFIGESVIIALLGLMLGIVIVETALPTYNAFLGKELMMSYGDVSIMTMLAGLILSVGLVGGLYPAVVISGFRPAQILKANKSAETSGSLRLRSGLVVVQFTISIMLIVSAVIVYGQMLYATTSDPGFNEENLIVVHNIGRKGISDQQQALIERVRRLPGVQSASLSSDAPLSSNENNTSVEIVGDPEAGSILLGRLRIDHDFFETYQIPIVAGRAYDQSFVGDGIPSTEGAKAGDLLSGTLVVNESALKRLGLGSPQEALGRLVRVPLGSVVADSEQIYAHLEVIGVASDTKFQSLRSVIRPEMYYLSDARNNNLGVRYSGNPREIVSGLQAIWSDLTTSVPFRHEFVDQMMIEQFMEEENLASMLGVFSSLAVLIACMGLYGLASFTAQRRTKEIGIRKVMGARVQDIVGLLAWQFSKPVFIAMAVAWPVAFWVMSDWLESFVYRVSINPLWFAMAGAIALGVALVTVASHAFRAARSAPVEALRYE